MSMCRHDPIQRQVTTKSSTLVTRMLVSWFWLSCCCSTVQAAFSFTFPTKNRGQRHLSTSTTTFPPTLLFAYNNKKTNADSKIGSIHKQRLQSAGRIGTKRYIDPCKVFFGNLPFSIDESQLESFVCQSMGMPAAALLHKVRIVRDWKTQQSKGYGFVDFMEPIYATVAMDKCHGTMLQNRTLTVTQGKKKPNENVLYIQKKNITTMASADPESQSIQEGIRQATVTKTKTRMDPQEKKFWRLLDPDLVEDDDDDDDSDYDDYDDDDIIMDDQTDNNTTSVFTGNRKSRREQARKQKRIKPPSKGFGT